MKKITVKEITYAALALTILSLTRFFDYVMPRVGDYVVFETAQICALFIVFLLPLRSSIFSIVLAPFMWLVMGQTLEVGPGSFFFDLSLPLLATLLIKIVKFKKGDWKSYVLIFSLAIIAGVIRYFSYVIAGVLYFEVDWKGSFVINAWSLFTCLLSPVILLTFLRPLNSLKKHVIGVNYAF